MITAKQINKLTDKEIKQLDIIYAQEDFYFFCQKMIPEQYTPGKPHLKKYCHALQLVYEGKINKLLVSMPPRWLKSLTCSLFCAWIIGKDDDPSFMRNAYGQDLANKFSYDIRAFIQNPVYLEVFPNVKLKQDKKNVTDWAIETASESTYFCAGVGGPVTGKGCKTASILDDPIKNMEEALSNVILESKWMWYQSTHRTRMAKGCAEIHIATRWSDKDPIGRIKETNEIIPFDKFLEDPEKYKDNWIEILIKATDENGNSNCEEIKTTEDYQSIKAELEDFIYAALYDQEPIEAKGLLFSKSELNWFSSNEIEKYENNKYPERWDTIYGYVDVADEGTDYLSAPIAKVIGDKIYVTDVLFTQDSIELTEPAVSQLIIDTNCDTTMFESNNGGKSFAKNVERLLKGKSKCSIKWQHNSVNKETRILMKSGQVKKNFYFRSDYKPGSDYAKFIKQLTSYVKMGKNDHDDAPDSMTGLAEQILNPRKITAGKSIL